MNNDNFKRFFDLWVDKEIPFISVDPEAKWHQLLRYSDKYNNFVETGTATGVTTELVSKFYKSVYTVELSTAYYSVAKNRLGKYNHVHQYLGSSASVLKDIVSSLTAPAVFYLDGHFSGEGTGRDLTISTPDTPVVLELESIAKSKYENIVIIDDARLFEGEEWHSEEFAQYPSFEELRDISKTFHYKNKIYRELDAFIIEPESVGNHI